MNENITIQHILVHAKAGSELYDCILAVVCLSWRERCDVHLVHNEKTYIVEIREVRNFLCNKIKAQAQ